MVRCLLAAGADTDATEKENGFTAILFAAAKGFLDVVQDLLKAGADFEKAENDGATALYLASRGGHLEAVKLLHQAGAVFDSFERVALLL